MLVDATAFTAAHKQKLLTLVQSQENSKNDDTYADVGAPAASIYKTRKAEVNAKHNFGMLKQSLEDQLKFKEKKVALEHDLRKLIIPASTPNIMFVFKSLAKEKLRKS